MENWILIAVIVVVFLLGGYFFINKEKLKKKKTDDYDLDEDTGEDTIESLIDGVKDVFSKMLRTSVEDDNLTKEELARKKNDLIRLRNALSNASSGNARARKEIKNRIQNILTLGEYGFGLTEKDIDRLIPFRDIGRLSELEIHETLLYLYGKKYGTAGFNKLVEDFNFCELVTGSDGKQYYKVTKKKIREVMHEVALGNSSLGNIGLTFLDKLEILTQLIYSRYQGLGVVDSLYYQDVDEIDCGISGVPVGGFDIAISNKGNQDIHYSYESVWVVYHGINLHLKYIGFQSEEEFVRVCENVYRYNATETLSQRTGRIVSTMPDGSRIAVNRPPMSESWAFFLRKFSAGSDAPTPTKLISSKNNWIPINLLYWIIRGEKNMVVLGQAGSGKTTFLKMLIGYINPLYNIRVLEMAFELSLRYMYPDRNIITFQKTDTVSTEVAMDYNKKTNATVMIMGEIAEAMQAVEFVQTCQVNSRLGLATHHAGNAKEAVEALAGNYTELGLYKDKNDAVAFVAKTINLVCHLETDADGFRHITDITEIIPYDDIEFPSESAELREASRGDKTMADASKFFKDSISPKKFETRTLCHFTDEGGERHFVLDNLPSKYFVEGLKRSLKENEIKQFEKDMESMERLWRGESLETPEAQAWIDEVYSR